MRPDLAGRAAHVRVRLEQQVPTAGPGGVLAGDWQVGAAVPLLRLGMLQVDIHHHELVAGRHADQRLGPSCPPPMHRVGIGGRVLEAISRQRALVLVAGEHRDSLARELESCGPHIAHGCASVLSTSAATAAACVEKMPRLCCSASNASWPSLPRARTIRHTRRRRRSTAWGWRWWRRSCRALVRRRRPVGPPLGGGPLDLAHGRRCPRQNAPLFWAFLGVSCRFATSLPFQLPYRGVHDRVSCPGEVGHVAELAAGQDRPPHVRILGVGRDIAERRRPSSNCQPEPLPLQRRLAPISLLVMGGAVMPHRPSPRPPTSSAARARAARRSSAGRAVAYQRGVRCSRGPARAACRRDRVELDRGAVNFLALVSVILVGRVGRFQGSTCSRVTAGRSK